MTNTETIAYLDKIDEAYAQGKIKGWSRYGTEWGIFSRPMNLEVRKKIEANHPEKLFLKMILPYWFNRSIALEIYYEKKHKIRRNRLRFLSKECENIRKEIGHGKFDEAGFLSMADIAGMSFKEVHA